MAEQKEGIRDIPCEHHTPNFLPFSFPKCDCVFRIDDGDNAGFCKRPEYYRCVKEAGIMPVPLSHSSVQDYIKCPRLYYYKAIRGIVAQPFAMSAAVKMGQLWDAAKQRMLGAKNNPNDVVEEYQIDDFSIAKVKALKKAYEALEIEVDPGYKLQAAFDQEILADGIYKDFPVKVRVKGFYDRKYANYFSEDKLSSRPDNYLDPYFIQSQVGTYFIADPALEYCIMEVVRVPDLKSTGRFKDESAEEYTERAYSDIVSRPSYYFLGYDKAKKRYGKKFYRNEFDLESIKDRFRIISLLIRDCQAFDGWYRNDSVCNSILPGIPCDMRNVCRLNSMGEDLYKIKDKAETI